MLSVQVQTPSQPGLHRHKASSKHWAWIILLLGNPLLDGFLLIQELSTLSMRSSKIITVLISSSVSVNRYGGGKFKKRSLD